MGAARGAAPAALCVARGSTLYRVFSRATVSLPTSHAIMVPPGSRHSLALFLSCAVIAANPAKAGDPLMQTVDSGRSDLAESSESTKGHLTVFPGENPSELELVRWLELLSM